jgi:hypothetical protein
MAVTSMFQHIPMTRLVMACVEEITEYAITTLVSNSTHES